MNIQPGAVFEIQDKSAPAIGYLAFYVQVIALITTNNLYEQQVFGMVPKTDDGAIDYMQFRTSFNNECAGVPG
jgi:hypothetical protein